MYKRVNDLEIRLLFLHQMSEFMTPDCDMHAQNWSFLSQLFQGTLYSLSSFQSPEILVESRTN